jgi:hypothetical protein
MLLRWVANEALVDRLRTAAYYTVQYTARCIKTLCPYNCLSPEWPLPRAQCRLPDAELLLGSHAGRGQCAARVGKHASQVSLWHANLQA